VYRTCFYRIWDQIPGLSAQRERYEEGQWSIRGAMYIGQSWAKDSWLSRRDTYDRCNDCDGASSLPFPKVRSAGAAKPKDTCPKRQSQSHKVVYKIRLRNTQTD